MSRESSCLPPTLLRVHPFSCYDPTVTRLLATHIPKKKGRNRRISFEFAALGRCSAQDVASTPRQKPPLRSGHALLKRRGGWARLSRALDDKQNLVPPSTTQR